MGKVEWEHSGEEVILPSQENVRKGHTWDES